MFGLPQTRRRWLAAPFLTALGLSGCDASFPCTWDTSGQFRDRERVIPTEPGVSLACAGAPVDAADELGAFYGSSVSPVGDGGLLFVRIVGDRVMTDITFAGTVPDGTYELVASMAQPEGPPPVWASSGLAAGTFTFSRSRNVPFVDIKDPEMRVYESSIDVEFDLALTDLSGAPAGPPPEAGCTLTTGKQTAHLVQSGSVGACEPGPPASH